MCACCIELAGMSLCTELPGQPLKQTDGVSVGDKVRLEHLSEVPRHCCATPDLENYTLASGGAAVRTTLKGTARGRRKPRQWDALLFLQLFCQPQAPRMLKLPSVPYVIAHSQPDCRAKFAM